MKGLCLSFAVTISAVSPAFAQAPAPVRGEVEDELEVLRGELLAARRQLADQEARLAALETRLATSTVPSDIPSGEPATRSAGIERVGTAPENFDRPPELAVLGMEGSVVTRRGQLTAEAQFEYARADRNRAVFRGIEVVESVLVGVFDINESRQDVLTAAGTLRYGITDKFEIGARVPYVYRNDASILAPIAGSTPNDGAATIDSSASGNGIGDVELSARYQIASAKGGWPFLIANLQAVIPTGTDPFAVRRDEFGRALEASTGAGFYGFSPSQPQFCQPTRRCCSAPLVTPITFPATSTPASPPFKLTGSIRAMQSRSVPVSASRLTSEHRSTWATRTVGRLARQRIRGPYHKPVSWAIRCSPNRAICKLEGCCLE